MTDIVDLNQYKKERTIHRNGHAQCTHCRHQWYMVAVPEGTDAFDCPNCGLEKGVFAAHCRMDEDEYFTCDCGSLYFHLMRSKEHGEYDMCVNCGKRTSK